MKFLFLLCLNLMLFAMDTTTDWKIDVKSLPGPDRKSTSVYDYFRESPQKKYVASWYGVYEAFPTWMCGKVIVYKNKSKPEILIGPLPFDCGSGIVWLNENVLLIQAFTKYGERWELPIVILDLENMKWISKRVMNNTQYKHEFDTDSKTIRLTITKKDDRFSDPQSIDVKMNDPAWLPMNQMPEFKKHYLAQEEPKSSIKVDAPWKNPTAKLPESTKFNPKQVQQEIIFLRHGEYSGESLTDRGVDQVRSAAASIAVVIDAIYHSPKKRTTQSAQIVSETVHCKNVVSLDWLSDDNPLPANPWKQLQGKRIIVISHAPVLTQLTKMAGAEKNSWYYAAMTTISR